MARREEYATQANACREAATEASRVKNPAERDNQLGMAEKWEALGRQRVVHKQLERVLAEAGKPDSQNRDADKADGGLGSAR